MGIKFVEEGNQCVKCKKLDSEVEKITYYTDPYDDYQALLCSECIKRREKPYTEICPKCKRVAYKHGGLTYYDDSDADELDDFEKFDNFDYDEKHHLLRQCAWNVMGGKVAKEKKSEKSN